jgi:hypothetical protein
MDSNSNDEVTKHWWAAILAIWYIGSIAAMVSGNDYLHGLGIIAFIGGVAFMLIEIGKDMGKKN